MGRSQCVHTWPALRATEDKLFHRVVGTTRRNVRTRQLFTSCHGILERATCSATIILCKTSFGPFGCLWHNTHLASAVDTSNLSWNTVWNRDSWMPRFSLLKKSSINGIPASCASVWLEGISPINIKTMRIEKFVL